MQGLHEISSTGLGISFFGLSQKVVVGVGAKSTGVDPCRAVTPSLICLVLSISTHSFSVERLIEIDVFNENFYDEINNLTASEIRAVDPNYSPGYKTMFSDAFPFLLASQVPLLTHLLFFPSST